MFIFLFNLIRTILLRKFDKYLYQDGHKLREVINNNNVLNGFYLKLFRCNKFHSFMLKNVLFYPKEDSLNTKITFLICFLSCVLSCVIVFLAVVLLMMISLVLMEFILSFYPHDNSVNAITLFSAIGTMGAAIFAAMSAKEVSLSNKAIKQNNKNEEFYKKFSILLDKHDNYLSLINDFFKKELSIMFKIEYLSTLSCGNALKIIRGNNDGIYNGAEGDKIIAISEGNSFAKNVLSPYMRILYHTLKSIDVHFNNDKSLGNSDAKQYSNIIRSLIPNDLLFLVALNSVIFYKQSSDKSKTKDLININNDRLNIYNDYHKFFKLLTSYDFFEHLNISNDNGERDSCEITKFNIRSLYIHDDIYSINQNGRNCYVIINSGEYHLENIIKKITDGLKKISTLQVIGLFYFYDENRNLAKSISWVIKSELEKLIDSKIKECSSDLELHENTPQLRYNNIDDFINYFDLSKIKTEIKFGVINPKEEIIVIDERYFFSNLLSGSLVNIPR